jgi:hypothetical protein
MDLKNMNVNCAKVAVAQGATDANVNTELALDVSICSGRLADTSSNCGNVDYPMDFIHLIEGLRGHTDDVQSRQK